MPVTKWTMPLTVTTPLPVPVPVAAIMMPAQARSLGGAGSAPPPAAGPGPAAARAGPDRARWHRVTAVATGAQLEGALGRWTSALADQLARAQSRGRRRRRDPPLNWWAFSSSS